MDSEHPKLSPRKLRSIEKHFEEKERRLTRQSRSQPSGRGQDRKRKAEWDEEDDAPDGFEKIGKREPTLAAPPAVTDLPIATVIEARGRDYVVMADGELRTAKLASRLVLAGLPSPIVAGDQVRVTELAEHVLRIDAVEQRRSVLGRFVGEAYRNVTHDPIAANVDLVLLICSPQSPPFRPGLIDRYFTAAALEDLPFAICLNKLDLGVPDDVTAMLEGYASLGIDVFKTSATTRQGIGELQRALQDKITLFTGHSGVGKSSLLNAIEPGLTLRTGDVTQATAGAGKGTHTTTSARLVPLSIPDAYVVDSPGIREFGLGELTVDELLAGFPEVAEAAARCEVRHCRHRGEPGCAVERDLTATPFGQHRLASYRSLIS